MVSRISFLRTLAAVGLICLAVGLGAFCWADQPPPIFGHMRSVAVSRDGSLFAMGDDDITLINTSTGRTEHALKGCGCSVSQILVTPDDQTLVSWVDVCSDNGDQWEAKLWNLKTGRLRQVIKVPKVAPQQRSVARAVFTPSGPGSGRSEAAVGLTLSGLLATATVDDPDIRFWNTRTGKLTGTAPQEAYYFSSDGVLVPRTDALKSILKAFSWHLNGLHGNTLEFSTFSPDGHRLLTMNGVPNDGRVVAAALWDTDTGKQLRSFPLKGYTAYSACLGEDEALIAGKNFCRVWNLHGESARDLWQTPAPVPASDRFSDNHLEWSRLTQSGKEADVVAVWMLPYNHPPYWFKEKQRLVRYNLLTGQPKKAIPLSMN